MKKLFYPALFHKAEEGGFWITFPDFPECMTQGENMQNAYEMAWDALGLAVVSRIENRESLPPATEPYAITAVSDTFRSMLVNRRWAGRCVWEKNIEALYPQERPVPVRIWEIHR